MDFLHFYVVRMENWYHPDIKWLLVVRVHILPRNDCPNHEVSADLRMFQCFPFNAQ